ncbi:MAG TPA: hypothetical protein VLA66_04295 [Thermoanaerobaculia bacterium]|nr:hypothetical protein [Thermoanaerobaculia bacterium]
MRWTIPVLLAVAAVGYFAAGRPRGAAATEVVDWSRDPIQTPTDRAAFDLDTRKGRVTVTPRATYDVAAVVERVEPYWLDAVAFLSPFDLALAWGEVPTPAIRDRLDVGQSWRFFFWRTEDPSIDVGYVIEHSANTHVIPANANVRRALGTIDAGDEVRLHGLLVDVASDRGLTWQTSLVRTDHGDRGCEIVWVESVQIGSRFYR